MRDLAGDVEHRTSALSTDFDERDVARQIQETLVGDSRKLRVETRLRRCGNCSQVGHNARTCWIVAETFSEEDPEEL